MFDRVKIIKEKGYYPDIILDIGANVGSWTDNMKSIYSDTKYHLFEAIDYSELNKFDNDENVTVHNVLLFDKITVVNWYEMRNTGDSIFKEISYHFNNCEPIKRETIDLSTYILHNNLLQEFKNILIKIDCQGAELSILKGATLILDKTDFIILEVPFFGQYNNDVPSFLEHITFMNSIGFIVYDIIENHYVNNFNMQVDILFINKNHRFNSLVNKLLQSN